MEFCGWIMVMDINANGSCKVDLIVVLVLVHYAHVLDMIFVYFDLVSSLLL